MTDPTTLSHEAANSGRVARHLHTAGEVAGTAALAHTHTEADVTSLTADLAAKQAHDTTLDALAALADTSGALLNNGAGTLSWASVPLGTVGTWRQAANLASITATTTETAFASNLGSFPLVSGRRYRFTCFHVGQVTTGQATTERIVFRLRLGAGTAGTIVVEHPDSFPLTGLKGVLMVGTGLCGTDFAAGTTSISLTGAFTTSNTWTPNAFNGTTYATNAFILVEDIGI